MAEQASIAEGPAPSCGICQDLYNRTNNEVDLPCSKCRQFFCEKHTSKLNPVYCDNCLRITEIAPKIEKLIDEDGNTHEGRKIILTPEYWMAMSVDIMQMSESELENHVNSLKAAVREIELLRDFRQIALAHSENELEQRKIGRYRRLRLLKDSRSGKLTATNVTEMRRRSSKPKTIDQVLSGFTKEQMVEILKLAQAMASKKK